MYKLRGTEILTVLKSEHHHVRTKIITQQPGYGTPNQMITEQLQPSNLSKTNQKARTLRAVIFTNLHFIKYQGYHFIPIFIPIS